MQIARAMRLAVSLSKGNRSIYLCVCVTGSLILIVSTLVLIVFPVSAAYATRLSIRLSSVPARCHNLLELSRQASQGEEENLYLAFQFPAKYFDVLISISFSTKSNANKVVPSYNYSCSGGGGAEVSPIRDATLSPAVSTVHTHTHTLTHTQSTSFAPRLCRSFY